MSRNEFDELLLKKLGEAELEYNPASWDSLSRLLPGIALQPEEFDASLNKKFEEEDFTFHQGSWDKLSALLPAAEATSAFDKAVTEKINSGTFPYNPASWNKLAALLPAYFAPKGNTRRFAIPLGIAAALLLFLGTTLFLKLNNSNVIPPAVAPTVVKAPSPGQPLPERSQQTLPANTTDAAVANAAASGNNQVAEQQAGTSEMVQTKPNAHQVPSSNSIQPPGNNSPVPFITDPKVVEPIPDVLVNKPVKETPVLPDAKALKEEQLVGAGQGKAKDELAYYPPAADYSSAFYEGKGNKMPKTSIAVAGGVNYGNLNTGYSAGVSVRRKVAGDFFVDGTVAMLYNNNANNVVNYSAPQNAAGLAARPATANTMSVSSPAIEPTQNLYYVQFNPSVGYQIEKHVALSVGGDFQQMVQKKEGEEKVQLIAQNAKLFPNFDVGITTKSEFSITPNIQAGLIYREGLNNLLKNEGSKYVNRRYVQVQFKYNLPVN